VPTSSSSPVRRGRQEGRHDARPTHQAPAENNTIKVSADVPPTGVLRSSAAQNLRRSRRVLTARWSNEVGRYEPWDVVQVLKDRKVDVLVSYPAGGFPSWPTSSTPVGCLDAKVAFVNALPVFIASDAPRARRSSPTQACRLSAFLRHQVPRSARPPRTASWPSCRGPRGPSCCVRTSSTCGGNMDFPEHGSSASGLKSKKKSPRPSRSPRRSPHGCAIADVQHRPERPTCPWLGRPQQLGHTSVVGPLLPGT